MNLVGVIFTVTALGGLAPWSRWQFIGVFGLIEAASGLANVISPNIWRLPVAELQTSGRTDVKLAASALLLPHWGGLARCAAGLVCLALGGLAGGSRLPLRSASCRSRSPSPGRSSRSRPSWRALGVARPELDVFQLIVRWGRREKELPPVSIGASVFQFLLSIVTIPAVKLLPPSVLYRPELAPSLNALLVSAAVVRRAPGARRAGCGPAASSSSAARSSSARPRSTPEQRGFPRLAAWHGSESSPAAATARA